MSTFLCHASIDRIVDGRLAVLIPYSPKGPEGSCADSSTRGRDPVPWENNDWMIPVDQLPPGAGEGVIVKVFENKDGTWRFQLDPETTQSALTRIRAKMEYLKKRTRERGNTP